MVRVHVHLGYLQGVRQPSGRAAIPGGRGDAGQDHVVPPLPRLAAEAVRERDNRPSWLRRGGDGAEAGISRMPLHDGQPPGELIGSGIHGSRVHRQHLGQLGEEGCPPEFAYHGGASHGGKRMRQRSQQTRSRALCRWSGRFARVAGRALTCGYGSVRPLL